MVRLGILFWAIARGMDRAGRRGERKWLMGAVAVAAVGALACYRVLVALYHYAIGVKVTAKPTAVLAQVSCLALCMHYLVFAIGWMLKAEKVTKGVAATKKDT